MIEIQVDLDAARLERKVHVTLYVFVADDGLAIFDRGRRYDVCFHVRGSRRRLLLSGTPGRADPAFQLLVAVVSAVQNCGSENDPRDCGAEENENQRCNLAKQWSASCEFVFTDWNAESVPRGRSLKAKDLPRTGNRKRGRSDTCVSG